MDIGELVLNQTEDGSTVTFDIEESKIQLEPWVKEILITAANPYYQEEFVPHVMNTFSIDGYKYGKFIKPIRRKLNVSDTNPMFAALCIALKNDLVSTEEILDGKNMEEELLRFKVRIRRLTRTDKGIMAEIYNYAIEHHGVAYGEISEISQYGYGFRGSKNLGISNHAQLAFFAHIYTHLMHNQVEEQLTGHQLDALEALVVKTDRKGVYNFNPKRVSESVTYYPSNLVRRDFGVQTSMDAVLKALDLGFYTLLLEVDIPAFLALNHTDMDFLKITQDDSVALRRNSQRRQRIYKGLGIHTRTQLAPYIFLVTKLDEHEMDSLRSAHASPDQDPMQIIYEKFKMPEHSALLAPNKYFAAKREMAAKN
ncbi:MAG: hypothetical protein IH934_00705 [Nanoarchaeota archaeon]|nr:hypothetical protein [Nanoarchaeota archaeon]